MKVKLSAPAAEEGTLRIWLRRVPVSNAPWVAFSVDSEGRPVEEIARANVYGRGLGSGAMEKAMLLFRFRPKEGSTLPIAGETLEIGVVREEGVDFEGFDFEISEVV